MKYAFLALVALSSVSASAFEIAQPVEVRISGAAARELWDSLNIPAVAVRDEHSGIQYGIAKYGTKIGCERALDSDSTYCWFKDQIRN